MELGVTMRDFQAEIDRWLDGHVEPLAANESTGFTEWRRELSGPLFVYGAGGLGQKLVAGLRSEGVAIEGFCDSNPAVWGKEVLGLSVMSPEVAVAAAGDSGGFIISTWSLGKESRNAEMRHTLERLGVKHVTFFTGPFWEYPRRFLPHYRVDLPSKLLAARRDILAAAGLLADADSRRQFFVQLQMLATTTFDEVSYVTRGDTYFPVDLVSPAMLRQFVDCGAYDGDTFRTLVAYAGDQLEQYWGFEPDPVNISRLRETVSKSTIGQEGRTKILAYAVGEVSGPLRFNATGDVGARAAPDGATEVECRRLDDELADANPTFIKMDIEGSELEAISGAARLLAEQQPACAVCVYHYQDHLWKVPLRLHAALPRHRMYLRAHQATFDVVCYAVPQQETW